MEKTELQAVNGLLKDFYLKDLITEIKAKLNLILSESAPSFLMTKNYRV